MTYRNPFGDKERTTIPRDWGGYAAIGFFALIAFWILEGFIVSTPWLRRLFEP